MISTLAFTGSTLKISSTSMTKKGGGGGRVGRYENQMISQPTNRTKSQLKVNRKVNRTAADKINFRHDAST